jgi:hypothetical protein
MNASYRIARHGADREEGEFMPMKQIVFLLAATAMVCLSAVAASGAGIEAVCDATLEAWSQDSSMQQYISDYACSCSNGNSSPPVCVSRNSGSETQTYSSGSGKTRGPSDEMLVLQELQKQVDQMFQVNWQTYRKYQQESLQNGLQINKDQQAALQAEEERRKKAAREDAARREIEALEVHTELLGMPPSGGSNDLLDITGALDEDARKKQLAECPGISEKIARYENGIRHINEVTVRNDRMLREAEADEKKAEEELSKVKADVTSEALSMGLKSFVQTQQNLQRMKDLLVKMGMERNYGQMSYDQIVQAQKLLDRGLTQGQNVIDLTDKVNQYRKTNSLRNNEAFAASPYDEMLKTALTDFKDKFLYDAGGLEFLGENMASMLGPAWELSFKSAVVAIKATAAGMGMKESRDQQRGFNENQDKMGLERFRLEQRIAKLRESFVNNRCPVSPDAGKSAFADRREQQ